jgi:hypothetical protein
MIDYQFLLAASIAPIGALLIAFWLLFESRHDRANARRRREARKHLAE